MIVSQIDVTDYLGYLNEISFHCYTFYGSILKRLESVLKLFGSARLTLNGNTANWNTSIGIRLQSSDGNTLNENTAFKNLGTGFSLTSSSDDNTLEDNMAKNNDGFGFIDTGGAGNVYTDNKCAANGSGGSAPTGLCSPQE